MPLRSVHPLAALALALCLQGPASAQANQLVGCWQAERVTQFLADGKSRDNALAGTMDITAHEITTRGPTSQQPRSEINYTYAIVRPGVYVATIASNNLLPESAGSSREYEFKVEGDVLRITTYPQTTKPAPLTAAVRVESTPRRTGCTTPGK